MNSRFLNSVDARMAAAKTALERAQLEASKANFLARQGSHEQAKEIVSRLRSHFADRPDAGLSASLHLVDGLIDFFHDLSPAATDKLRRAYALAAASGARSVAALSAAWLAHMDFSAHRFEGMGGHLTRAFEAARDEDHAALSRCSSVCAVALHLGRDFAGARYWYRAARLHGLQDEDNAAISSYMHNQLAMAVMSLRQAILAGDEQDLEEIKLLLSEARSTEDYDELTGAVSLSKLIPILKANLLSLQGKPREALQIYDQELLAAREQGMERMAPWLLADMASCHLRLGDNAGALALALEADGELASTIGLQVDDAAAARSRLAEVFAGLGHTSHAEELRRSARTNWGRFRQVQEELAKIAGELDGRFRSKVLPDQMG